MSVLRVYLDPAEIGSDGYPFAWHGRKPDRIEVKALDVGPGPPVIAPVTFKGATVGPPIKDLIRKRDGDRCLRCKHPYVKGEHGRGEWSVCDELCTHPGPTRVRTVVSESFVEAQWRILTVHHLNGIKHDCRWWNLVSLCQRCHLTIQGRVAMERVYPLEHSEWFKPFAAGWYAFAYLGEELERDEVDARLDELLALERAA